MQHPGQCTFVMGPPGALLALIVMDVFWVLARCGVLENGGCSSAGSHPAAGKVYLWTHSLAHDLHAGIHLERLTASTSGAQCPRTASGPGCSAPDFNWPSPNMLAPISPGHGCCRLLWPLGWLWMHQVLEGCAVPGPFWVRYAPIKLMWSLSYVGGTQGSQVRRQQVPRYYRNQVPRNNAQVHQVADDKSIQVTIIGMQHASITSLLPSHATRSESMQSSNAQLSC